VVTVLEHRNRVYVAWNPPSGSLGNITEFDADGVVLRTLGVWGLIDSMAADATHLIVATPTITLRHNLATGFVDGFFVLPDDVEVILVQGGSLVSAGTDGVVRRFNRVTGAPLGTMSWTSDIISMATLPSSVGAGSCYAYDCPCGNADALAGCRNSTGVGSWLGGSGSASLTADDLTLAVTNVPPGSAGRLFMGTTATSVPFGDGVLCAAGSLHRFPMQSAGQNGTFTFGPGIAQFSHDHLAPSGVIQAGFTWHFQAWYRNPSGPCGSGFNTSNSFRVTFAP
jgi:hypothetical protein